MGVDWSRYFLQCGQELRVILLYSIFLSLLTLALEFLLLDNEIIVTIVQIGVFFSIAYFEDPETIDLLWPDLLTRFTAAWISLTFSAAVSNALKTNYKDEDLPTFDTDAEADGGSGRATLVLVNIFEQYLDDVRMLAGARMFFLMATFIIYVAPDLIFATRVGVTIASTAVTTWLN